MAGTTAAGIMGCFTPDTLPVLAGLARRFAVCGHWFASVPTETLPNRAFACAATSQGHGDDKTRTFTAPSVFGQLEAHGLAWAIDGHDAQPLTKSTSPASRASPPAASACSPASRRPRERCGSRAGGPAPPDERHRLAALQRPDSGRVSAAPQGR